MLSVDGTSTSPLVGVTLQQWRDLVRALTVQGARDVSESGGFGYFDLRPPRLADLGIMRGLEVARTPGGRQVFTGAWVAPHSAARFLGSLTVQHAALAFSLRDYDDQLTAGTIARPAGCSRAGALAILHRGGRSALAGFPALFSHTRALFERSREAF